jgi:putative FmdB family regulatory protein
MTSNALFSVEGKGRSTMPIYEYSCKKCENHFELLLRTDRDQPVCPDCGGKQVVKQFSVAAAHSARSHQLPVCGGMMGGGCNPGQCAAGQCPLD